MVWEIEPHSEFTTQVRKFQAKYERELKNALNNLDTFLEALQAGAVPQQVRRGFIHPEPKGVLAFDQRGKGKHLKQIRLYVYPDESTKILHVIRIGDKNTQNKDVRICSEFVECLRDSKNEGHNERYGNG